MAVYGVKGWVKVFSHTDPKEAIFKYQPWHLRDGNSSKQVELVKGKSHGKGLVAQIDGIDDRNIAQAQLVGRDIMIAADALPESGGDTYYWRDLIGLRVINRDGQDLGKVATLLETGAHDVLQVQGDSQSIDNQTRLLPWSLDKIVDEVSLVDGLLHVDWHEDW